MLIDILYCIIFLYIYIYNISARIQPPSFHSGSITCCILGSKNERSKIHLIYDKILYIHDYICCIPIYTYINLHQQHCDCHRLLIPRSTAYDVWATTSWSVRIAIKQRITSTWVDRSWRNWRRRRKLNILVTDMGRWWIFMARMEVFYSFLFFLE